jgi:hypothetical protein
MKPFTGILGWVTTAFVSLLVGQRTCIADANSATRPGGLQFDGKISRQVLENYLSRSICIEGMLNGRGLLAEDIRMLTNCGAKYVARALCFWGEENNFLANIKRAKEEVPQVLAADPEIVLEGCVFETVGPSRRVPFLIGYSKILDNLEQRNFRYEDIICPAGQRRAMGTRKCRTKPDGDTALVYCRQPRIDVGCEGLPPGR